MTQKQRNIVWYTETTHCIPIRIKKYVNKDSNNLHYNKIAKSTAHLLEKEKKYYAY